MKTRARRARERRLADAGDLVLAASHGLRRNCGEGYGLVKAGVMMLDLMLASVLRTSWAWRTTTAPTAAP